MRFVVTKYGLIILLLLILSGLLGMWFLYRSYVRARDVNVLLISIDTCRADRLSCYGYKSKTTPNIDALAAEGTLFENVIAPIPQTLPSHSSMLTGTIPPYHGVHENVGGYLADESNITLAEILKDAGFTTGAAISTYVLNSQFGIYQGFDDYHDRFETPREGERGQERKGGETTGVALEWLEENKDKRFFFFLHYYDPHRKYEPPEPFASRFGPSLYGLYAGEIAYTDHCIGRVLDKLKELGLYDSTLIIITSDHGEMLGEHGELTHSYFIYQSAIKVPLIFKLPGQNKPARIKSIAGLIDIVPTVCGLLNIETPKNVQGLDLFANSKGENTSGQGRHIYCESLTATKYRGNSLLGIVNDDFKYIQTTRPELYELITDPGESNNVVKKQQRRARIMQDELAQMLEQSLRQDSPDNKVEVDPEIIARFGALGYVGGAAIEDFSFDQTKEDPKDLLKYHSLFEQMNASIESKEYEKAERYVKQMIQQQPDLLSPYHLLGAMHARKGEHDQAIQVFGKVIRNLEQGPKLKPKAAAVSYNNRGSAYYKKGDYDRAIRDFDQAIKLNPNFAEAYSNRAVVYERKGQHDRAIHNFDRVIKLTPNDAKSYNSRGNLYLVKGDLDQAIHDLNRAIELNPSYAEAYNNRGVACLGKNDYEGAIRNFNKAIELNPSYAEAYNNRSAIYGSKGDYDQAIRDLDKAIESNPSYTKAYYNRGNAYWSKGEYDRAIRDLNKAIELNPSYTKAYYNRGNAYLAKGDYKEAIRDFDQAIKSGLADAKAYNNLAWILATHEDSQVRDGAKAVHLAEKACELTEYKLPYTLDTLAAAYAELGQFDKAVKTAEKAMQLARAAKNEKLAKDIQSNLELYKAKRPYRE